MSEMPIEAVRAALERHLAAPIREVNMRPVAGGNGQETWFVDATAAGRPASVVLRRDPPGGSMEFTDRREEFDTLRALESAGLPIPRALAYGSAQDGLDRPFLLMERLPGAPPRDLDPPTRSSVGHQLGTLLARLHSARAATPDRSTSAAGHTRRHVTAWRERYDAGHLGELPMMDALFGWLERNVPETDRPAVSLWGDPGPHNLLVEDGEVTAMLDWELAHDGDPLDDLGAAIWACLDTLDPADVVRGYEEAAGVSVQRSHLDYFVVLACATRSAISARGATAFVEGRTPVLHLAGLALSLTSANLARAAVHAGWGAIDDSPAPVPPDAHDTDPTRVRPDGAEITLGVARVLDQDLASRVEDRSARRELRIAAALLRTAANLSIPDTTTASAVELDRIVAEVRRRRGSTTLARGECVHAVERLDELADLREPQRAVLLADLARRRALLDPLAELYQGVVSIPRRSPFSEEPDD